MTDMNQDERIAAPSTPRELISRHVATTVAMLQRQVLNPKDPGNASARAALARLRRASVVTIGEDPAVGAVLWEGLPDELLGRGPEPSRAELAINAALVLSAIHGQSASAAWHTPGVSLGSAVRSLADHRDPDRPAQGAIAARFHRVAAADSWAHRCRHLTSLIQLLRTDGIPLDYGRLARDLDDLQNPSRRRAVQLAWGRAFHRSTTPSKENQS